MCGDDDDHSHLDEDLFNHFLKAANKFDVLPDESATNTPIDLKDSDARSRYIEGLFKAGLTRAVNDAHHLQHGHKMDVVAGQAIAFARLSGMLAAQLPPEADLFHAVISALMEGHKQAAHPPQMSHHHHHH
jgi:hypothetical protein